MGTCIFGEGLLFGGFQRACPINFFLSRWTGKRVLKTRIDFRGLAQLKLSFQSGRWTRERVCPTKIDFRVGGLERGPVCPANIDSRISGLEEDPLAQLN